MIKSIMINIMLTHGFKSSSKKQKKTYSLVYDEWENGLNIIQIFVDDSQIFSLKLTAVISKSRCLALYMTKYHDC